MLFAASRSSSSSASTPPRRRRRRRRRRKELPLPHLPETRDWADLPRDAVATVLGKLPVGDALAGLGQVCRSWRRAAAEEPALWRRVEARFGAGIAAARLAVWRSAGRCEAFESERVADDRVLLYLAGRLSCLKSLCLISCYSVSSEGFIEAIQGLPLLEKLELSLCKNIFGEAIEVAGKACPHVKRFRLSNDRFYSFEDENINDQEALGISTMHELHSLQLFANNLTNRGLAAILDNCPHLESLDIRHCFNVQLDSALKAKCSRIKTLRLPNDITDDYEFEVKSPIRYIPYVKSNIDDIRNDHEFQVLSKKNFESLKRARQMYLSNINSNVDNAAVSNFNSKVDDRDWNAYDPFEIGDVILDDYEMYETENEDVGQIQCRAWGSSPTYSNAVHGTPQQFLAMDKEEEDEREEKEEKKERENEEGLPLIQGSGSTIEPYDKPSIRMEEPREIPEDEEAMMLDYYALLYEQELDEHKPDEDDKMV